MILDKSECVFSSHVYSVNIIGQIVDKLKLQMFQAGFKRENCCVCFYNCN